MENLPVYISIVFILTTFLSIYLFYTVTNTFPPRFLLVILPPLLLIAMLFLTAKGRRYIDNLNARWLTVLHIVRIPVELVIFWLYLHKAVPELMTFEGRNFDIISDLRKKYFQKQ